MAETVGKCTKCHEEIMVNDADDASICPCCGQAFVVEKAIQSYADAVRQEQEAFERGETLLEYVLPGEIPDRIVRRKRQKRPAAAQQASGVANREMIHPDPQEETRMLENIAEAKALRKKHIIILCVAGAVLVLSLWICFGLDIQEGSVGKIFSVIGIYGVWLFLIDDAGRLDAAQSSVEEYEQFRRNEKEKLEQAKEKHEEAKERRARDFEEWWKKTGIFTIWP